MTTKRIEYSCPAAAWGAQTARGKAIWLLALLLGVCISARAQQVAIGGYPIPTADSQPTSITTGSDGALWFIDVPNGTVNYGLIERMTPAGAFTKYHVPLTFGQTGLGDITSGPDGALWFTEYAANQIGRITTAGHITAFPVTTPNSSPGTITTGPDGALWFTEYNANQIGRITKSGRITEYPVPTAASGLSGLVAGPDGALWFTEFNANQIGRITIKGKVTEYPVPTAASQPVDIAAGPDGALWFTESNANQIGRITTAGSVSEFPVPTPFSELEAITAGPDGAVWFAELNSGRIGRITTAGAITEYLIPAAIVALPNAIISGPGGALWFTEYVGAGTGSIGQLVFPTASLIVNPSEAANQTTLTFTGAGFEPGENVQIYTKGIGSPLLAHATADSGGTIIATAGAPVSPYGPRLFLGAGQSSGDLGAAAFTAESKLVLNPVSGPAGTTVTVQGIAFGSFESVSVWWNNPRLFEGRVKADVNGEFSGFTFAVPASAPAGHNLVLGTDFTPAASAPFLVQ
jgi:virginiamycin B lyase